MKSFLYKQLVSPLLLAMTCCMSLNASDCKFEDLPAELTTKILHMNVFQTYNFFQSMSGIIGGIPAAEFLQLPHLQCFENIQELIIGKVTGWGKQEPYFNTRFIGALTNLTKLRYFDQWNGFKVIEWTTETRPESLNEFANKYIAY